MMIKAQEKQLGYMLLSLPGNYYTLHLESMGRAGDPTGSPYVTFY
jgi:hypothetical protein